MKEFSLPKRWTVAHQRDAYQNQQARLHLDHTIRSHALKLGAAPDTADALVLEARTIFTIINAVPVARDACGATIFADGLLLTPEAWLHRRLAHL